MALLSLTFLLCMAPVAPQAETQEAEKAPEMPIEVHVNHSIAKGVDWLRRKQEPSGIWRHPSEGAYPRGLTALVAFTLVKSGIRRNDECLLRALETIRGFEFKKTYSAGCHLLLLESLNQHHVWREEAQRTLDFLLATQKQGLWAYPESHIDMSNVQFALLGLRAAHRMGLKIPDETLIDCAKEIWRFQNPDGGFAYVPGRESSSGMTAATLAGLAILEEIGANNRMMKGILKKRSRDRKAGEKWLDENFTVKGNSIGSHSYTPGWHYPNLWAIERYAGLTNRKEIGGKDWYEESAKWLSEQQNADGIWNPGGRQIQSTAFSLLTLRKATVTPDEESDLAEMDLAFEKKRREQQVRPQGPVPYITDWLVAGPWDGAKGENLLGDPPFDPAKLRPRLKSKTARRSWQRFAMKEKGSNNLEEVTGSDGDYLLWATATNFVFAPDDSLGNAGWQNADWSTVDGEPFAAKLWFSFDDGWDVYWNGKRVSHERRVGAPIREDVQVEVELLPGANRLVVLAEDRNGISAFSCRITDTDGKAISDQKVLHVAELPKGFGK